MQDELTTSLSAAIAAEIYRAEASAPPRPSSNDITAWDRFLKGLSYYYLHTKADYETSIDLFREAIALDPTLSIARAYLATIQMQGMQFGWIKSTRELWKSAMSLAESSVRLDPRSSFAFSILSYLYAIEGRFEEAMDAIRRAVELNPYDMGARGVQGMCHFVSGEHRRAIELFSMATQRDNGDPRYQGAALTAFSHYLLGHMTRRCPGRGKPCIRIPIICRHPRCERRRSHSWAEPGKRLARLKPCSTIIRPSPSNDTCAISIGRFWPTSRITAKGF